MYLKSLEMQGFKSFADKISMEFGTGITAVVGPNGSGKSNISDAIRWVMGEQSAKSLRGGNMQDVIFAGTQKRKPLGFAEVSLCIDNSDKKLAIDYEEVIITRRVFRSGESEYFINKSSCRLKDIHELFMDTGVGREGYSIIGQGKIAEIISSKAEDRRQIFEEASGITKYRYRKEEAERKLARTHENVMRVSDIITELELQLEPLRQQSEKAKKFLNLREQLKILEVNVSLENIARFKKALEEVEAVYSDIESRSNSIKVEIESIEKQTAQMFDNMRQNEELTEQKREAQANNTQSLASFKSDIEVLKSKIEYNCESISRIETEIDEQYEKQYELDDSLLEKDDDIALLVKKDEELNNQIHEIGSEIDELEKSQLAQNEKTEQINTDIIEKMNEVASIRAKTGNFNALIESFQSRQNVIAMELDDKKESYESLLKSVEAFETESANKNNEIDKLNKQYIQQSQLIKSQQEELQSLQKDRQQTQIKSEQTHSRLKLLDDMEKTFDNYSRSVKSVMQSHQSGELKNVMIFGTLAQLIKVPEKFAVAVETSLGAAAQNIVTQTENDAKKAIEFLKRNKAGRATFLPVSAAKGGTLDEKDLEASKGFMGIASNLVDFDIKLENVVKGLLGRVVVVDNIDNAVAMARKYSYRFRIVTLEGELLTPGGAMSGGSKNNTGGLFSRANELTSLGKLAKDLKIQLDGLMKDEQAKQKLLNDYTAEADEISAKLRTAQEESISLASELKHSKTFLQSLEGARNVLLSEQNQTIEKIDQMQLEINRNADMIEQKNAEIAALEKELEVRKEGSANYFRRREEKASALMSLKMELSNVKKDIELHNERVELVKMRRQEITHSIEQKKQNIEEINEKNDDLNDDIEFKSQQIEEIEQDIEILKKEIAGLQETRRKTEDDMKDKQKLLSEKREEQFKLQEELGRIESKKAKAEVELENTVNRLWEEYELTITAAEQYRNDMGNVTKSQKSINQLKDEIRSLGNINIDAIDEYASIKERFEFLNSQRNDLVDAQKNLESVIADMVQIMKEQFEEKFKIINENFNEVFVELFGGGRAKLVLTEPNDILASGVNIDVQPPGKAVKSMIQLSGGEQAFVSIALLFAILKVRPSPFCILDEIEAALDDVNVYRFADYLRKFAVNSQFIVVTHRRGTMESANILYGVTMQEQGVTNLLSLNIDDVEGIKV